MMKMLPVKTLSRQHLTPIQTSAGRRGWRQALSWPVVCGLLLGSHVLSAAPIYVAVNGDNNNNGASIDQPLQTIAAASSLADAGDTIYIRGGTYHETVAPLHSGTAEAPITYTPYNNERVIIDATDLYQGVMLWDVSNIVIDGLRVENCLRAGIHVHHHMDVPDAGSDNNRIENNTVTGCGSHGIYLGGNQNLAVNNTVSGNGTPGSNSLGHGIYILGDNNVVDLNLIKDNEFQGIRMEGKNLTITNNRVQNNKTHGIGIWTDDPYDAENIEISRNQITGNLKDAIQINGGGSGGKPHTITITDNIIGSHTNGIVFWTGIADVSMSGNRLQGDFTYFTLIDETSATNVSSVRNVFKGNGAFSYLGTTYSTLTSYQNSTGMEAGSRQP